MICHPKTSDFWRISFYGEFLFFYLDKHSDVCYNGENKNSEIKTFFQHLKKENVSLVEIKKILDDVYGGEEND